MKFRGMKKWAPLSIFIILLSFSPLLAPAQCSICTKTAQQLGEKPAKGLNSGILYLAFMPMAIVGVIGFRWWRSNRSS
jgi:hypothetical protein